MTCDEFYEEVTRRVVAIHGGKPWFRGVCVDRVDEHFPDVDKAVEAAELDTWYHDGMVPEHN